MSIRNILIAVFILNHKFSFTQNKNINIIEKRLNYNIDRINLSIEYLKERHGIIQDKATITPIFIVLHYTAGGTINSNYNYFNNAEIENSRKLNKSQSTLNVSAHYLIDRDGTIYHLIEDTLFARHTIGLNYCAIGIENIGGKDSPLTNEQIQANALLIRKLCGIHKIKYLIGHSEYINFRKSIYWKETNPNYITYKEDPGDNFLIEVRKLISDLNLKYKP